MTVQTKLVLLDFQPPCPHLCRCRRCRLRCRLRCWVVGKSCVAFVGQSFEKGKETQEIQKKITQSEQKTRETVQGKEM